MAEHPTDTLRRAAEVIGSPYRCNSDPQRAGAEGRVTTICALGCGPLDTAVLDHLRLLHPDVEVETWPDGGVVVVDMAPEVEEFE